MHIIYCKVLHPINDIKTIIFHPIEHKDSESIPVLVCKCVIMPRLRISSIINSTKLLSFIKHKWSLGCKPKPNLGRTANKALNWGEELGFSEQNQKEASFVAINGGHSITVFNQNQIGEGGMTEFQQNTSKSYKKRTKCVKYNQEIWNCSNISWNLEP